MMDLRNSIGFIGRMNPLIISMGKISFLDPIVQYSTIPPFQLHVLKLMGHPSGVKPMPGPLGQDSYTLFRGSRISKVVPRPG
jgi:hypothetical protein